MNLVRRASRLLERARWKEEGWDRPDPPDILREYAEESGVHAVHMSKVGPDNPDERGRGDGGFKVGINPRAMYSTPKGVYCYPLNSDTYDRWFGRRDAKVPFAASRDWMYVLENDAGGHETLVIDEGGGSDFTRSDTLAVLELIYQEEREVVERAMVDEGHEDTEIDVAAGELAEHPFFREAFEDAKIDTPIARFWNATRKIAFGAESGNTAPTLWNRLLREYGNISTVVDHGSGLVHDNEPNQVVFLDPTAYEAVDVVPNVWDWWDREKERRDNPERIKRETFRDRGIEHMIDAVKAMNGMGWDELDGIADILAGDEDLQWIVNHCAEQSFEGEVHVSPTKNVASGRGLRMSSDARLRDIRIPPEILGRVKFTTPDLFQCTFGTDYFMAVTAETKPFSVADLTMCSVKVLRETVEDAAWEGAERELDDELIEALRTLLYDGEITDVPGLEGTFKRLFGFDYLSNRPQFEANTLEVG